MSTVAIPVLQSGEDVKNILADASLPKLREAFPLPFKLTLYHHEDEINALLPKQDILLCRAALKVDANLLKNHQLRYLATASSGTDHLDYSFLQQQNIQVLDAKGCNAAAVADYIVSCFAYLKKYHLLQGQQVGIIGMGYVGSAVYQRLKKLNYCLQTYDPLKAQNSTFKSCSLADLYACDVLCLHAALHQQPPYPSFNLINKQFLAHLKPGTVLINAARGGIVNEQEILQAMPAIIYCTDVYSNEPQASPDIIAQARLCTPHIAGHSMEAKQRAVFHLSRQLHALLHLEPPSFAALTPMTISPNPHWPTWQQAILAFYNPEVETLALKKAADKKKKFLSLRKDHQFRHEFIFLELQDA